YPPDWKGHPQRGKDQQQIAKVQQSHKELRYREEMRVVFIYSTVPKGSGYKRDYRGTVKTQKENHAGHGAAFITIKNQDQTCCARSIITAKAKLDNDPKYKTIMMGDHRRQTMQKRLALELMQKAGLDPAVACGFPEIAKMQEVLGPLYQVKVWDRFRELIFSTEPAIKVLHIYLDDNHYDVIGHIKSFHNASYFCEVCNKAYTRAETTCAPTSVWNAGNRQPVHSSSGSSVLIATEIFETSPATASIAS
ncbi:MAG: hypothetical protein GY696_32385, partial [Gammaproteobacteria bacterium]|nr:hypothetical protein [Gammaproteobacteria bacterium]